jgi:hypothetical protein
MIKLRINKFFIVRLDVLTVMNIQVVVVRVVTLYSDVVGYLNILEDHAASIFRVK